MAIEQQIIEALQEGKAVQLTGMGTLTFKVSPAVVGEGQSSFSPPKRELQFAYDRQLYVENEFSSFARLKTGQLLAGLEVEVNGLGKFKNEEGAFKFVQSESIEDQNSFGLETLELQQTGTPKRGKPKRKNRLLLWVFLVIIPIAILVYLGITYQNQIFKNSNLPQFLKSTNAANQDSGSKGSAAENPQNNAPEQSHNEER